MKIIWFDFCAICILLILLLTIWLKNTLPTLQNRIFKIMVWLVLISTICDFFSGIWDNIYAEVEMVPYFALELNNYLYFISRNATSFVYAFYIATVLELERKSPAWMLVAYSPIVIDVILIAFTPFYDWVFYLDSQGVYHRGPMLSVLYVIALYYLMLAIYLIIRYRKFIPFYRRLAFYSFVSLALGTVLIQGVFPNLLVEGFGTTLCILMIYLTIQRPEEVLDGRTGLLNKNAFITMVSMKLQQRAGFEVLVVVVDDVAFLERSLSLDVISKLTIGVGQWLRQNMKHSTIYHVFDGHLCIIPHRDDLVKTTRYMKILMERFDRPWNVDDLSIVLPSYFLRIRCPEDASTPENLLDLIEMVKESAGQPGPAYIPVERLDLEARQRRRALKSIVRDALDNELLEVVYQPIYSVGEHAFSSAEALLRLRHPVQGYIPPDEFIPVAEESGAIVHLGRFVLDNVCRFFKEHQLWKYGVKYIEVNLSVVECLQDNLADSILTTLEQYGLSPEQINFEITETAASSFPETVTRNLERLAEAGVRFSLDDYGSGYSNLNRMLGLPLDIIKIDKSLIQKIFLPGKQEADVVLTSTFQMLRKLNKRALAEGVETKEQAEHLIRIGCEYIQGYYFARPMEEHDFLTLVSNQKHKKPGNIFDTITNAITI